MSQPRPNGAVDEFFRWERQSWVEVVADMTTDERAHFMPRELLKSYFTRNDCETLQNILNEVFAPEFPPIDPELVLRDHTAVFCILLAIGKGKYIEDFARYEELSDRRLPFDPSHPPQEFTNVNSDPEFVKRFCDKQRMYCVPVFDGHMLHKHFGAQRLLPITFKEPRGIEGMAGKYAIKIYGPHNKLVPGGAHTDDTFVLKRYPRRECEGEYKLEVNGFRSVRAADSIIKFYGSYIYGDEFNILLEYGDKGSLEEYFKRESPPSRGLDIIRFWESMFKLIEGLKVIHSVREGHHDVKPGSIVVLSNGAESPADWSFKFADFGQNIGPRDTESILNEMQNAPTYEAPERYRQYVPDNESANSERTTWLSDIWSLGCIYSEAAMWIADGYKGVTDYRNQRMAETEMTPLKGAVCFHDGAQVLQSVLDAHRDIEDRLRRSDYITKDILESMVDEMLWEEDRPSAKALSRKAEIVLSRARQKLSATPGSEPPRPGSRQRYQPSRLQPPKVPLPPIPTLPSGLSSISEQQYPLNVENWRAQVPALQPPRSQFGGTVDQNLSATDSVSILDRELNGSIASWQLADNNSQASPLTPFTSPHVSVYYDQHKHNPNEGRARVLQPQASFESRKPANPMSRTLSYGSGGSAPPRPPRPSDLYNQEEGEFTFRNDEEWNARVAVSEAKTVDEMRTRARAASRASSRQSTATSGTVPIMHINTNINDVPDPIQIPPKSRARGANFSLFPTQSQYNSPPKPEEVQSALRTPPYSPESVPRSVPMPTPNESGMIAVPQEDSQSMEYLSVNTCIEWKKAHKKTKKQSKVPPLPGAQVIEDLKDRDHMFIVDDSTSMAAQWPDLKRVFEALTYVVKNMSPDGTELFYTVSYDTYRRKDSSDLCAFLEKHPLAGETNISYRLNLQLQGYVVKLMNLRNKKPKKGEKLIVRPMSIYILTNGEWGQGPDPKIALQDMADFLKREKMTQGQVTVEFISFAQTPKAAQRLSDLAGMDFGMELVDHERWTGNVLKMLRGPLDRITPKLSSTKSDTSSIRPPSSINTYMVGQARGSSFASELA